MFSLLCQNRQDLIRNGTTVYKSRRTNAVVSGTKYNKKTAATLCLYSNGCRSPSYIPFYIVFDIVYFFCFIKFCVGTICWISFSIHFKIICFQLINNLPLFTTSMLTCFHFLDYLVKFFRNLQYTPAIQYENRHYFLHQLRFIM